MAWEKRRRNRRYYYTTRWIDGAARKFYIGKGFAGELAAERVLRRQRDHAAERERLRAEKAAHDRLSRLLDELDRTAGLLARASLLVAGFHQHDRGSWRRRRVAS